MNFQFHTPTQIVVGRGQSIRAGQFAASLGKKAFAITSETAIKSGMAQRIFDSLMDQKIEYLEYKKHPGEPSVEMANAAAQAAVNAQCDLVISLGGGSAIDLGKAVAGLATNGGVIEDYLEGVGTGRSVDRPALPHIAIPTTAGAGAEVTRNAVIRSAEGRFKKSFRSPYLYPTAALLDVELTTSLPPLQTAFSGMDAITQLIEAYITCRSHPFTDALALYGLELALPAIQTAFRNGSEIESREKLLIASTLSGICLANAGLGMAHGFASGLGALYDIPHGKACAILLPHAIRFNRCAQVEKLSRVGRMLGADPTWKKSEQVDFLAKRIAETNAEFGIPSDLREYRIPREEFSLLIQMSMGNSMSGNPIPISGDVALTILEMLA